VQRKTWIVHGRKNKPDVPAQQARMPVLSMSDALHEHVEIGEFSSDSDYDHDPMQLAGDVACDAKEQTGRAGLTRGEMILMFLDTLCTYKMTDSSGRGVWSMMQSFLPAGIDLPSFTSVKNILCRAETRYVKRYDLCPEDCIVYYDSTLLSPPVKHAHRTLCPVCGTPRYVRDPQNGQMRAAKQFFFFPVAPYIRSLFARPELVPYLLCDAEQAQEGHVRRSRGFKLKVTDNPYMNADHRNIGLIGTTDGVPLFDDQRRTAWPFVFRCANLPDSLSTHMSNCHLSLVSASEFWEVDESAGILRRRVRGPKSLQPHLTVIVDDLLHAYSPGVRVLDASVPSGHEGRHFRCKCLLLFWTGDYPAQSSVTGQHSKTCHWCQKKSTAAPEVSRRVWDGYRQYLPMNHPWRKASAKFGKAETREPIPPRTHEEFVDSAKSNARHLALLRLPDARSNGYFKKDLPYKTTGIKEISMLGQIPLFNLVWDTMPCFMHIGPDIWRDHVFDLLAGNRAPAPVKLRKKNTPAENQELHEAHGTARKLIESWSLDTVHTHNHAHLRKHVLVFLLPSNLAN
jgi:hypothetical protein